MSLKLWVSGIYSLGRKCQQEIAVEFQSGVLKHRQQYFISCARISRRLQNDQLTPMQAILDLPGGCQDVGDIGFLCLAQGRGNTNDDCVAVFQMIEIRGRSQTLVVDQLLHNRRGNIADV